MNKIAEINFYPFIILWKILKEKFLEYSFELEDNNGNVRYILIRNKNESEYPANRELVLQIHDPFAWDNMPEGGYDNVDLNNKTIKVVFLVWQAHVDLEFLINQSTLDNDDFIFKLKLVIGKIVPSQIVNEDISKWIINQLLSSGLKQYFLNN